LINMTGGGFGPSGHDNPANWNPANWNPGAAGDPEQTVRGSAAGQEPTLWGSAATPPQQSWGAPWEPPAVDYPPTGEYPPPNPAGYQAPYGSYPPPPQYVAPPASYGPYGGGYYAPVGTNGMAIGSLVSSIVGFLCCQIGAVVGIILGIVALNQIKQTNQDGRGVAIAGIVIGGLGIAVTVIFLFFYVAMHNT
jgi:Domain of unknown function (DUF4190)